MLGSFVSLPKDRATIVGGMSDIDGFSTVSGYNDGVIRPEDSISMVGVSARSTASTIRPLAHYRRATTSAEHAANCNPSAHAARSHRPPLAQRSAPQPAAQPQLSEAQKAKRGRVARVTPNHTVNAAPDDEDEASLSSSVTTFLGGLIAASSLAVGAGLVLAAKASKR